MTITETGIASDLTRGQEWAIEDFNSLQETSTAKELAIVTFRAMKELYHGASQEYRKEMFRRVRFLAEINALDSTFAESDNNAAHFEAVAAVAQEQEDLLTPGQDVRAVSDETHELFEDLMRNLPKEKHPDRTPKTLQDHVNRVKFLQEKLTGRLNAFQDGKVNEAQVLAAQRRLNGAIETMLAAAKLNDPLDDVAITFDPPIF